MCAFGLYYLIRVLIPETNRELMVEFRYPELKLDILLEVGMLLFFCSGVEVLVGFLPSILEVCSFKIALADMEQDILLDLYPDDAVMLFA